MANSRYDIPNNTKNLNTGTKVYKTIFYPVIKESQNDIFIFTKQGDRLDLLAFKYYNDVTKWWIIAHANKIKGTMVVPLNTQLRIPMDLVSINNNLLELNT